MGLLNRKMLLTKEVLKIEKVDLGEGDFVCVRQMTGRERDNFEQALTREIKDAKGQRDYETNLSDFRAKLAVNTICDEKGELLLNPSDFEQLSKNMSYVKLQTIIDKAQELNKITKEDKDALTKNSSGDPVASSTSDSV